MAGVIKPIIANIQVPKHPLHFEQVRIENTALCGYHCVFCPREKLTRKNGVMSIEDFELVLERIGHHSGRVDLHGFGEPLLDRSLPLKIRLLKRRWPSAIPSMYSTLGTRVVAAWMRELVEAGLQQIEVSLYGFDRASYRLVHGVDKFEVACENLRQLCSLRDEICNDLKIIARAVPHHNTVEYTSVNHDSVYHFHNWLRWLGIDVIRERALHNYGVGRKYNPGGKGLRCSVTWGFRYRVLQLTWDLQVIPCCFDFNADMPLGDLHHQTLNEIFDSDVYRAFYRAHWLDDLQKMPICRACERCYQP